MKGLSESALKRGREGGKEALAAHPAPGMIPRLTAEQKRQLPDLLVRGAEGHGFRGDVWTSRRVAEVISRTSGVRSHRDRVSRLLREVGWRRLQPVERATQRDEQAIQDWCEKRWPTIKKSRKGRMGDHLGRRSGLVSVTGGHADLGAMWQDPDAPGAAHARLPLSAQCITPNGRLFLQVRPVSYDAAAVAGFLRKISGKTLLIWDGSPIHRGQEIKDFLKHGAASRLHVEQLPAYAPDLNPDEGIWNCLKRVELGNVCCPDLNHLSAAIIQARERLRHKREIIRSCSRQGGYLV